MKHLTSYFYQHIKPLLNRPVNKNGYLFYLQSQHSVLFKRLHRWGFFDFYITNSGWIVSEHQIVAFFLCGGYKAMLNGFTCSQGEIEIHHINANTQDNRPDNLVYLSTTDHKVVSHLSHTSFLSTVRKVLSTPFNKQGKSVADHFHYLSIILSKTLRLESVDSLPNWSLDFYLTQKQKVTRFFQSLNRKRKQVDKPQFILV